MIIVFVLVSLITVFGLNIYSKSALDSEVNNLLKKDVIKDKYDTETKALFKYGKVEKAIKEYMKDYSDNIKKAEDIINDETIKVVLSGSNYKTDGPNFDKSLKLLEEKQKEFNSVIDKLLKMTDKKEIMKYIDKYKLSDDYVKIYKDYMFGKKFKEDVENNKNIINKINETGTKVLNTDITVLKLLKDNQSSWILEDGTVSFYSNDIMQQYNNLVQSLK